MTSIKELKTAIIKGNTSLVIKLARDLNKSEINLGEMYKLACKINTVEDGDWDDIVIILEQYI